MCLPSALASATGATLTNPAFANMAFGMQALAIGAQYIGQSEMAKAQEKYQEQRLAQTQAVAATAARDQYMGMNRRQSQAREAASQDMRANLQRTLQASASSRVAAAAGGVSGVSANEVTADIGRQYGDWAANRAKNLPWQEQQIRASMDGIRAQQIARVQGAVGSPIATPSPFAAFAQLGAAALDSTKFYLQ